MLRPVKLIGFLCLFLCTNLFAHGDLHEQIERTTKRIEKDPQNPALYLKRGQLFAQHQNIENAIKDLKQARNLKSDLFITDFLMAKMLAENEQPKIAINYANQFLENQPNHAEGLIVRAGIFQQLDNDDDAKIDWENAINNIENPNPRHFISIAEACGNDFEVALYWLERGQAQFGFDIVLKEKEVEILTQNEQYGEALYVVDKILQYFPRKEKWLFQKGKIYKKANQKETAVSFYKATLIAIETLPKRTRKTRKMIELKAKTIEQLQELGA